MTPEAVGSNPSNLYNEAERDIIKSSTDNNPHKNLQVNRGNSEDPQLADPGKINGWHDSPWVYREASRGSFQNWFQGANKGANVFIRNSALCGDDVSFNGLNICVLDSD